MGKRPYVYPRCVRLGLWGQRFARAAERLAATLEESYAWWARLAHYQPPPPEERSEMANRVARLLRQAVADNHTRPTRLRINGQDMGTREWGFEAGSGFTAILHGDRPATHPFTGWWVDRAGRRFTFQARTLTAIRKRSGRWTVAFTGARYHLDLRKG